jgi:YjbE family integral membrane protein
VGGLGLLWIAYKLLVDTDDGAEHDLQVNSFWGAMKTIVVADALMGIDNVLGVAGAAQGAFDLVVLGLLISIPIVVFGSTLVLKLVERFPIVIKLGAAVLAYTAAMMVINEQLLKPFFYSEGATATAIRWGVIVLAIVGVLAAGQFKNTRNKGVTTS